VPALHRWHAAAPEGGMHAAWLPVTGFCTARAAGAHRRSLVLRVCTRDQLTHKVVA
jgi:hypothetical protein